MLRLLGLVVFFCFPAMALSQEILETIDINDFDSSLMGLVNSPVWQASSSELEETPFVQDILAKAPGVILTQSGGPGSRGALFLRGSESKHTLFMLDGLRLNDPTNTDRHFDTAFLFSNQFEAVQLLRGPSPVLYGGDATSGVIELSPRRGPRENQERLNQLGFSVGSFDTYLLSGQADWKTKKHQGTFGLMQFKTQGFSRFNPERTTSNERDGAESAQFFQASEHQWSAKIKTDLYLQGARAKIEQDGFDSLGNPIDTAFDESQNQSLQFIQTTSLKNAVGQSWIKTGINSIKRDIHTVSQGKEFYHGDIRQIQLGQQVNTGRDITLVGLNFDQENYKDKVLSAENDIFSGFLQQKINWNQFNLFLGARGESHQRYGEFLAYEASLDYQPRSEFNSYVKYAQGYKSPSLYQLFGPDSFGSPVGNPKLRPETNKSAELGVEWSGRFVASALVFQQDFQNLIAFTNSGYVNRGTLRVKGGEVSLLSPEHLWGQMLINFGVLDFSNFTQLPLRRPPSYGNLSWMLNHDKWGIEVGLRYLGTRRDVDFQGNNVKLSPYEILNSKLRYSFSTGQDIFLTLGNLTDRQYEDIWGYATAPVNWSLSYLSKF